LLKVTRLCHHHYIRLNSINHRPEAFHCISSVGLERLRVPRHKWAVEYEVSLSQPRRRVNLFIPRVRHLLPQRAERGRRSSGVSSVAICLAGFLSLVKREHFGDTRLRRA